MARIKLFLVLFALSLFALAFPKRVAWALVDIGESILNDPRYEKVARGRPT